MIKLIPFCIILILLDNEFVYAESNARKPNQNTVFTNAALTADCPECEVIRENVKELSELNKNENYDFQKAFDISDKLCGKIQSWVDRQIKNNSEPVALGEVDLSILTVSLTYDSDPSHLCAEILYPLYTKKINIYKNRFKLHDTEVAKNFHEAIRKFLNVKSQN